MVPDYPNVRPLDVWTFNNDSNSDMVLLCIGWTMLESKSTTGAKTNSRSVIPRCGISKLVVFITSPEGNNVLSLMVST
eukprot:scaffold363366_cov162-Cyclotella_meneghiniana.AAC.1